MGITDTIVTTRWSVVERTVFVWRTQMATGKAFLLADTLCKEPAPVEQEEGD